MRIARFIRFYGANLYYSPMWPTRDQVIPFRLFDHFERAMLEHVSAWEQLAAVQAEAHGQAVAMNGNSAAIKAQSQRLARRAYPLQTVDGDS